MEDAPDDDHDAPGRRPRRSSCELGCELLKLLRGQWLTRTQIAKEMDSTPLGLNPWLKAMLEHGLLVERLAPWPGRPGLSVTEYTVAPVWLGAGR